MWRAVTLAGKDARKIKKPPPANPRKPTKKRPAAKKRPVNKKRAAAKKNRR
jgi:hypothetical protein